MADTYVQLATDGAGKKMDTRTEGTNSEHRQVMVIGDPATNAGVAPVDATTGLSVDVKASALPTGAATSAKQPALGTAGSASTDVITVQGIASATPLNTSANASTIPSVTTMQNGATANGNGTNLPVTGYTTAILNVVSSVAMSGGTTINFEASVDDTTWVSIIAHQVGVAGSLATTTTADGDFRINCAGYKSIRARISAYSAGTITVKGYTIAISGHPTTVSLATGTSTVGSINNVATIGTSVTPGTAATNLGKAEDGAHTSGDVGVMVLGVRNDTPNTAVSGTNGDYTPVATTSTGAVRPAPISEDFAALANGPQIKAYYSATGATTDGIVYSPAAGKRWYITDLIFTTSAAATVTFEDDQAGGDVVVLAGDFAANSGLSHHFSTPLFSGEDGADLLVTTSAGNIKVTVVGYEI